MATVLLLPAVASQWSRHVFESPLESGWKFEPFNEKVAAERYELGRVESFEKISQAADDGKPRFDITGYPVLEVETTSTVPFHQILYLYHWWRSDKSPVGVRDSYHMLRASPYHGVTELPSYRDVFEGIPNRRGMQKMSFYLQSFSVFSGIGRSAPTQVKEIKVFGRQLVRTAKPGMAVIERRPIVSGEEFLVDFPELKNESGKPEIAARGLKFTISEVAEVHYADASHRLRGLADKSEHLVGRMHPQGIVYKTKKGKFRAVNFSNVDLIEMIFDKEKGTVTFDVFAYDFRQRTTRSSKGTPDAEGVRLHPNLAITHKLPSNRISIVHTKSSMLVLPVWQPGGHLASLAITEHADWVGIKQDAYTMYGNEQQEIRPGEGMAGNRIPVTKTIFPAGKNKRFKSRTAYAPSSAPLEQPSLESSAEFIKQLRAYRTKGVPVEIGVHCTGVGWVKLRGATENKATTSKDAKLLFAEAMQRLQEFQPRTWVDHGGFECLWERGWDSQSPYFILPSLKAANITFLNALGDKYGAFHNMIEDGEPSNLIFYVPRIDDDFDDAWKPIFFNTTPIGFARSNFTPEHLREIVNRRGFLNLHTYLPYESLVIRESATGETVIATTPWYNEMLRNIAKMRDAGDLHLATTRDMLEYAIQIQQVRAYPVANEVILFNASGKRIEGFTIGTINVRHKEAAPTVRQVERISGSKARDGVTYSWFDLPCAGC